MSQEIANHILHLKECWPCRCRAHATFFVKSCLLIVEWDMVEAKRQSVEVKRQLAAMTAKSGSSDATTTESDDFAKSITELDRMQSDLVSKASEQLIDFHTDSFDFFTRTANETVRSPPRQARLSPTAEASIKTAIFFERLGKMQVQDGKPIRPYPVPLAAITCEALNGFQCELDNAPKGFPESSIIASTQIRDLLSLAHRMPFWGPEQRREWWILFAEFRQDFGRFNVWVKKNHKGKKQHSGLTGFFNSVERGSVKLLKALRFSRTTTTTETQTSLSDNAANSGKNPDAIPREGQPIPGKTEEVVPQSAVWNGPLVSPEQVADKLAAVGREISGQALRNHYWKDWKPHDLKRGKAFLFYWDRIRPIVELQFNVKFRD